MGRKKKEQESVQVALNSVGLMATTDPDAPKKKKNILYQKVRTSIRRTSGEEKLQEIEKNVGRILNMRGKNIEEIYREATSSYEIGRVTRAIQEQVQSQLIKE